jgi:hypothetical protein
MRSVIEELVCALRDAGRHHRAAYWEERLGSDQPQAAADSPACEPKERTTVGVRIVSEAYFDGRETRVKEPIYG